MKVFTFFYNRYETATTSKALNENGIAHNVLIHNVDDLQKFVKGGFGSTTERKALRIKECAYLANKFNPLIKIAEKPGWDYGTHIRIYGSDGNIAAIRQKRGLL